MKVVFLEEIEGTAQVGEVKDVRNGFARNYLLPRGLAIPATKHNLQRADKLAKADAIRQERLDAGARGVADKIEGAEITLAARVGQQGRLFGSVTAIDIARELSERSGEEIDHRQVLLGQSIKTLGTQEVRVRLTRNVQVDVTVHVESEDQDEGELTIAEAVEQLESEEQLEPEAEEATGSEDAEDTSAGAEPGSEPAASASD